MPDLTTEKEATFQKLLKFVPSNEENFNSLLRLMYRNVVVPFLGAGFSANFGYPGWTAFIKEMADDSGDADVKKDVHEFLDKAPKQYEKAASCVETKYGSSFPFILSQKFGDYVYKQKTEGTDDFELLPELFPSLILTTNFDEVIEMLYSRVNLEHIVKLTPDSAKDGGAIIRRVANGQPTLIKLHGDVAKEEFVLAEKEYNRTYGCDEVDYSRPMPALLKDILLSKIVLFLGCSLEKDRTMELIENVRSEGCMSFALLQKPEGNEFSERNEFLYRRNIIPIWYPKGEHDYLKVFLRELAKLMEPVSNHSVTVVHKRVKHLLEEGRKYNVDGDFQQAYAYYSQVESLVKTNPVAFDIDTRFRYLEEVRRYYGSTDYGYRRPDILKDMLNLVAQEYGNNSLQYAWWLHGFAYTYEKYEYYDLMKMFFQKAASILSSTDEKQRVSIHLNDGLTQDLGVFDVKASVYISLGYVNKLLDDKDRAKEFYEKAAEINTVQILEKGCSAFVVNGLSRYYEMLGNKLQALTQLKKALVMRKEVVTMNIDGDAAQHLLNTYSNLIRIYREMGDYEKALEYYDQAINESNAWNRLPYPKDAEHRLHEDRGDVFIELGKMNEALVEYKESLKAREHSHWSDDIVTANLYEKIADTLADIHGEDNSHKKEAVEYLILACVIYQRSARSKNRADEIKERIRKLGTVDDAEIESRIKVQSGIMQFRYGSETDSRESELIAYFQDIIEDTKQSEVAVNGNK
ncbi:MAG: SIR2 family protein [Clostridia bacterium]|nr:SIR2 family protein [Clostridia bacterium]